jgi:hypothetical protein
MVLTPPQYYFLSHSLTRAREILGFRVNGSETLDPAMGPHVSTFSVYHRYSHLGDTIISQPITKNLGAK